VQQFAVGFVVALLTVVPVLALVLHTRTSKIQRSRNDNLERLQELSKLTGGLAHEIKNPLSSIKVNLKLIGEDLDRSEYAKSGGGMSSDGRDQGPARAIRKIAVVQKETDRLEQILDGFLRYIDRTELNAAPADLNELMGDMIDFFSPQAHTRLITVRQALHESPLICKIDVDMLKQAVLNLFINAQQAMGKGGELMIRTEQEKNQAVISINDTGSGIAPDKLPHIFDAYYSSRPRGSGLGLPTAKKIIAAHNGSITVRSDLGKGTSFIIKLPLYSA
jgi:signal transduction histidine kinase